MKDLEYRHFTGLEVRAAEDSRVLRGYAAVFNSESVDFGWFKEQIAPGAFTRTLKEQPDVRALVDHETNKVLARTVSKSLTLREDSTGLLFEMEPSNTTHGNDTLESVKRGDIDGMSIGFRVMSDKWEKRDGKEFRTILDVTLYEISVVPFPAYPETSVSARSALKVWEAHQAEIEARSGGRRSEHLKRRIALFEKLV